MARPPAVRNVLLILTDQHRAGATGYAGDPFASTPHLDALARRALERLGVRTLECKLALYDPGDEQLFDLGADPAERHNLISQEPAQAAVLESGAGTVPAWRARHARQ